MDHPPRLSLVHRSARAFEALSAAVPRLETSIDRARLAAAVERGHLTPDEEEHLVVWFARFLTVRDGLWRLVAEVSEPIGGDLRRVETAEEWRLFLLGYAAACRIVRLDLFLVEDVAVDERVQRKLNEGCAELRVPRKQFTAIFESLSQPRTALLLAEAMRLAGRERERLRALAADEYVGAVARELESFEAALDPSKRRFVGRLLAYGRHSLRRRGASAKQKAASSVLEAGGRLVAELRDRWRSKRVGADVLEAAARLLRPGDVIVTRHERALTNLFLPGFWPHAALYVGTEADRERLDVAVDAERRRRWSGGCCVLEALKDGVLFRPLSETLAVDAFAIVRPRLAEKAIARGLARAARHEGKLYNFDFDFFRSDRLVCTEVVYRAYDGLEGMSFSLAERAGRPTLSAEDVLDLALEGVLFEPVAVFGVGPRPDELLVGAAAGSAIAASYTAKP